MGSAMFDRTRTKTWVSCVAACAMAALVGCGEDPGTGDAGGRPDASPMSDGGPGDDGGGPGDDAGGPPDDGGTPPPAATGALIAEQELVVHDAAAVGELVGYAKPLPWITLAAPTFSLSGADAASFTIDAGTGAVRVAAALDAATQPEHSLTVTLTDGGATDTAPVRVRVLAEPDVVYIDPSASSSGDGSLASPLRGFDEVSWSSGHAYLLRRGTTFTTGGHVSVGADDVLIGAYGDGERPVIECTAVPSGGNVHAVNASGHGGVTIRDVEIDPDATSALRFAGDDSAADDVVMHGPTWGLRAFSASGLRVLYVDIFDIGDDGMFIQGVTDIEIAYSHIHRVNQHWSPPETPQSEAAGDGIQLADCDRWRISTTTSSTAATPATSSASSPATPTSPTSDRAQPAHRAARDLGGRLGGVLQLRPRSDRAGTTGCAGPRRAAPTSTRPTCVSTATSSSTSRARSRRSSPHAPRSSTTPSSTAGTRWCRATR